MIRKLSDAEYPLGVLEAGYRREYLNQDIRQSIIVGSIWLLPNFLFTETPWRLGKKGKLLPMQGFWKNYASVIMLPRNGFCWAKVVKTWMMKITLCGKGKVYHFRLCKVVIRACP